MSVIMHAIIKTMFPPGCHHNDLVATHLINHVPKCISCHKVIVVIARTVHCFHNNMRSEADWF